MCQHDDKHKDGCCSVVSCASLYAGFEVVYSERTATSVQLVCIKPGPLKPVLLGGNV